MQLPFNRQKRTVIIRLKMIYSIWTIILPTQYNLCSLNSKPPWCNQCKVEWGTWVWTITMEWIIWMVTKFYHACMYIYQYKYITWCTSNPYMYWLYAAMNSMNTMMNGQNFNMGNGMTGMQPQVGQPPMRNSSFGSAGSIDPFSNLNSLGQGQQKRRWWW